MKISCNKLKEHIHNSENIDWLKIWNLFSIRTAEVEEITLKGTQIEDVVVAEVIEAHKHPKKDNYTLTKVNDGINVYDVLCGAPNVKVGSKYPYVKVGGQIGGYKISKKEIAGVISEGMLCSGYELGINNDKEGILELPIYYELGADLKEILPIEDIIVEIDNKSLTNRPDLWGHYGIAREIAAITGNELKPLDLMEVKNDLNDLDIKIKDEENCHRFVGIKVDNIKEKITPLEMQIFLHYVGSRSISLVVDLTNYIMLEIGQPMHAYSYDKVKNIVVDNAKEDIVFKTLDDVDRKVKAGTLLINNQDGPIGIAGIMGGFDSEIEDKTSSIFLEAASFDATKIRRSSTELGLRTEASTRFEKTLDSKWPLLSIKRFLYLLRDVDNNIEIASNLTDVYPVKPKTNKITLKKDKLYKYVGKKLEDNIVIDILKSLQFKVEVLDKEFVVTPPSFRATKDITIDVDLIEEITRMYGYENIEEKPLILENKIQKSETVFDDEVSIKEFLTYKYNASEIHSYLWYDSSFLKQIEVKKDNVKVTNKAENNILRDEMTLSLLPYIKNNYKYFDNFIVYEIGTIIKDGNKRRLSILIAGEQKNTKDNYYLAKTITKELISHVKGQQTVFINNKPENYYIKEYGLNIVVDNQNIGAINIVSPSVMYELGKKKSVISIEIDLDMFLGLKRKEYKLKEISIYPEVDLDYTILMDKDKNYEYLETIIDNFRNEYIKEYKLINLYKTVEINKYSIRFTLVSMEKTLEQKDLEQFKNEFISYIREKNLEIIE